MWGTAGVGVQALQLAAHSIDPIISAQRRKCNPAATATSAEDVCAAGGAAEEAEGEVQIHPAADSFSCQA